jgi:transketolase
MRSIADLAVVSPADGAQLEAAIRASATYDKPIYFRIGRGRDPVVYDSGISFVFGKAHEHIGGEELTIIACGMAVHGALEAAKAMNAQGRSVGVIDMASIKPIDRNAILGAAARTRKMMTVEEHNVLGGLGAAVAEVLTDEGAGVKLKRHGIYDEYSLIAPPAHLYAHYKLDGAGIRQVAESFLDG